MPYTAKYFKNLHKRKFGSSCCDYPVRVDREFINYSDCEIYGEGCICDKCDKPCDLVGVKR